MQRFSVSGLLALGVLFVGLHVPSALAQETPVPVLNTAAFPGVAMGDICFDPIANQVYVVDSFTNDTHFYTPTLTYLGVAPSAFPPNTSVTGITSEPTVGGVIWSTVDTLTATQSIFAATTVTTPPTFIAMIGGAPFAGVLGLDAPTGLSNALLYNDAVSMNTRFTDYFGVPTFGPVANPGGVSVGISYYAGPFVGHSNFLAGGGNALLLTDVFTGLPVDLVGVLLSPGGSLFGFDYGPPTPAGANTIYFGDTTSGMITQAVVQRSFLRGDANSDGFFNLADAVYLLGSLFSGGPPPLCPDAADANDDGAINVADAVVKLNTLFGGGLPLPPPFGTCGFDPTPDPNRCPLTSANCP